MQFNKVNPKQSFPELEESIIQFWKENKIFEKSVETRPENNPYRFYDGPPFITGVPHYGHLLASTIKDVIPRYQTMKGKRVERVWGWDCHGIPVEEKVQKRLGIKSNSEIEEKGIENFINECYAYTKEISDEWGWYIDHIGRWVDFDNSYKTMDQDYMETVMNNFKAFYDKGLVYKGKRISLYSVMLGTPISNFEVAMDDSYTDVNDPAITVMFDLGVNGANWNNVKALVWTTTPRTLPANLALGVNKNHIYIKIKSQDGQIYVLAKNRADVVMKGKGDYEILEEFNGDVLVGLKYTPIFDFFADKVDMEKNFKVYHADFITDTDGTGIGHQAPEFGEVDFQLGKQHNLYQTESIDDECKYSSQVPDYQGIYVRDANEDIMNRLKQEGKLFKKENITHRVAICPRTQIPLIYRTQDSWFLDVQSLKPKLLEQNQNINWFPNYLKEGRFAKNIETAPDWCLSRKRYWATPMPMWIGYDKDGNQVDMKVFGSRQEIEDISGMKIANLHRPYIDEITWTSNGVTYKRVPEVLDVWLESGSMSVAQFHYPFENKEKFEKAYPADFIVEYVGQIRAWFYVMHVVGVALFGKNAYSNVITTGVIAGNDGRKMSKSFGNFTDPKILLKNYGGDAVRFYMLTTPVVRGEDMNFSDEGVKDIVKKVILPLWNTYYFFTTYASIDNFEPKYNDLVSLTNALDSKELVLENNLDKWLISALNVLIEQVDAGLSSYDLQASTKPILKFLDDLTNWYIRRSRRRFWKSENDGDKLQGYNTLYVVLVELSKVLAPFIPFVSESIFKDLTGKESVHLEFYPEVNSSLVLKDLNEEMDLVQKIINLGLSLRTNKKIRVRQPLNSISLAIDFDEYYKDILKEELNIKEVIYNPDIVNMVKKVCRPNAKILGPRFGKDVQNIIKQAKDGDFEELTNGNVKVGIFELNLGEFEVVFEKTDENIDIETGYGLVISMDTVITQELKLEGYARDLVRFIQEARKEADYNVEDRILVSISTNESFVSNFKSYIQSETLSTIVDDLLDFDFEKQVEIEDIKLVFKLKR
ncbi:MAG: isoleucine--tRNA ligase [Candidatus Absconditabacteria bacterium]